MSRADVLVFTADRVVVRGHLSADEFFRATGRSGAIRHVYWRHAFTPYAQHQLFHVPRSRYVEARGKGRGAFPVTIMDAGQP